VVKVSAFANGTATGFRYRAFIRLEEPCPIPVPRHLHPYSDFLVVVESREKPDSPPPLWLESQWWSE